MRARSLALAVTMTLSGQLSVGALAAHAAAGGDITSVCAGSESGSTYTLSADCDTTATLTVPAGFTVDGAGHEITAHDSDPTTPNGLFLGPVVTNAGTMMNLRDLTIRGTGFAAFGCNAGATPTNGVLFHNASGAITDVAVRDITQHATCQTFHSIQLRADAGHHDVTITGSTVVNYQRTGLLVQGDVTVHASGNTFGPPDPRTPNPGGVAQNTIQIGSPALAEPSSGTLTDNTIIGSSYGRASATSAGLLLAGARDLEVSHNTFAGVGTDIGVSFFGLNTGITIAYNKIARSPEDRPGFQDDFGHGVDVTTASRPYTTLVCNTFSGWNRSIVGATQAPCITSPSDLPCLTLGEPASLHLEAIDAADEPRLTWRLVDGELPPGLTLHQDGSITGTPSEIGRTTATIEANDPVEGTATRTFTFCVDEATPTPSPSPTESGTTPPTPPITTPPTTPTYPHATHPCPPRHRPPGHHPPGSLPPTGVDSGWWLGIGTALLGLGALAVRRSRRRCS